MKVKILSNLILVGVLLLLFGSCLLGFYIDYLWFQEVGYTSVFVTRLKTQVLAAAVLGAAALLLLWMNVRIARRGAPALVRFDEGNMLDHPQLRELEPQINRLLPVAMVTVALLAGVAGSALWETVLRYLNVVPFGKTDPLFGKDLAFYVFQLPLLRTTYSLTLIGLGLCVALAAFLYVLDGKVVVSEQRAALAPQVKPHLFTLLGLLLLTRAAGYQLNMYDLLYSPGGIVYGAGYTDVHVALPVMKLLQVVAAVSALAIMACGFRSGWKTAIAMIVLWLVVSLVGGNVWPTVIQKLRVAPNQLILEKPYLEHNIRFTRAAYNLENVEEKDFRAEEGLTNETLRQNDLTVQNIRLWDHRPLQTSYEQLQEIRTYYDFADVDVDRYQIDGQYRQVMLSAREISSERLPSKLWINERLTYTHGHGVVVSPVNRIAGAGLPDFLVKNIPPTGHSDLKITRPEIYYGERGNDYVVVKTRAREFDYPAGDTNVYTTYQGSGGVPLGGFWRRLAFAVNFKSTPLLLSGDLSVSSRVMFRRRIQERLRAVAPFLTFDRDPFIVISQGRLYWICDAYTVTDSYPYSQPMADLGNYLRNSVKIVIDAYDGSMQFYVADEKDPLIRAYRRMFPRLFQPLTAMSADLRSHLRVPRTLFEVQARIYAVYHMTDPQVFFNREDVWEIPAGAGKASVEELAPGPSPLAPRRPESVALVREQSMEPYYTIMKLPHAPREEFIQLIPFTPAKKDNLRAWMCARNDAPNYGKLLVYNFPKAKTIYGPSQINARIEQEAEISKQLTLWKQGGSDVIRGNLLIIPIEQSLLYVQSLYLKAAQGEIPELKRVIAAYGDRIVMETNLERSLAALFGASGENLTSSSRGDANAPAIPDAGAPRDESTQQQLARQALKHLQQARQSYRGDDWARFGEELSQLEATLKRLSRPAAKADGHAK